MKKYTVKTQSGQEVEAFINVMGADVLITIPTAHWSICVQNQGFEEVGEREVIQSQLDQLEATLPFGEDNREIALELFCHATILEQDVNHWIRSRDISDIVCAALCNRELQLERDFPERKEEREQLRNLRRIVSRLY